MSTMLGKAALSAVTVALGGLTLAPAEAQAMEERCYDETYSLAWSGWSAVEFTRDNGWSWSPAVTVTPWPGWAVIPGTSYVNYQSDVNGQPQSWTRYRTTYSVPDVPYGYLLDSHRLYLDVHADNTAWAYIDGYKVLEQPLVPDMSHFQGAPSQYMETFPDFGTHTLEFDVFNFDGPTGLNFHAYYQRRICKPCIRPYQLDCQDGPL